MGEVIFPKQFHSHITSSSKPDHAIRAIENEPAEIILMMTPDDPEHCKMRLRILAAHYGVRS
jgi:hypothetical protein